MLSKFEFNGRLEKNQIKVISSTATLGTNPCASIRRFTIYEWLLNRLRRSLNFLLFGGGDEIFTSSLKFVLSVSLLYYDIKRWEEFFLFTIK